MSDSKVSCSCHAKASVTERTPEKNCSGSALAGGAVGSLIGACFGPVGLVIGGLIGASIASSECEQKK